MTYTVRAGDTLSKIAMRNGVTLPQLLQANPQVKDPNKIRVGDVINVPNDELTTENTRPLPGRMAPKPVSVPTPVETTPTQPAAGALGKAIAEELGKLSAKYETGGRGPGTVSSGAGDPGGVSYGSYQMASKMGVPTKFVTQAGFRWLQDFLNLTAGTSQFTAVWKRIAAEQTDDFQAAQHAYIKKTHYDLLVAKILSDDKFDVNTRSSALQNVVWSTAVQHGPATPIVHRACGNISCPTTDPKYDELLIRAIYAERGRKKPDGNLAYFSRSSPNVQQGVSNRFKNELQDALAMLAKEA
ncbi:MAG TPA: LysM peptidoglycan-binding domain-containing protein [Pyrinomonadaceae bacterium]|jgi:LysM repeat protein|nr:LysM peptidoglycan-binding domain-containing protein [Pyrinomonadaceae bacterium]